MDKKATKKIMEFLTPPEVKHLDDEPILKENLGIVAKGLLKLIEELGYRKLPEDKPPLLSDEEANKAFHKLSGDIKAGLYGAVVSRDVDRLRDRILLQAQREVDIKHYEGAE